MFQFFSVRFCNLGRAIRRVATWATLAAACTPVFAQDVVPPVPVVVTFSILGDMVKNVTGDRATITSLVERNADTHGFEPTPQALRTLAKAQVLVSNGLGFEPWLAEVVESSGFSGVHVVASDRVQSQDHDPHAWHDLANGVIYVENIADGMALADPSRAADYKRRSKNYREQIKKLDKELHSALAAIPASKRKVFVAHNAFAYFGAAYGLEFITVEALAAGTKLPAGDAPDWIEPVRNLGGGGIFTGPVADEKQVQQLANETGLPVGGPLYTDALAASDEPAGTYLGMFHWNAGQLISVLGDDTSARTPDKAQH